MSPRISVHLLGSPCLRHGDVVLNGPPAQRHRIALLAILVASWPQPVARDRLLGLLWPDKDTAAGRRLLNLAIHVLRGAIGDTTIASVGDAVLFVPRDVDCDVHTFRSAVGDGRAADAVRGYAGPFLEGFFLPDAVEFDNWLTQRRSELARDHVGALTELARAQEAAGQVREHVATARRLVDAEPYAASHAIRLMRALDAAGDRGGALTHADVHTQRLSADLHLPPDADVARFALRLRTPVDTGKRNASVAVLPFVQIGTGEDGDYFAEGMTEDVIAHLSRIRGLTVISRASVMSYRDRGVPVRQVGRALGTSTVLDGTIRYTRGEVRIVATLIDTESEQPIWVETYDRNVSDIFAIQSDVALRIAAALRAELSAEERHIVRAEATRDIQAYRLFLRGRRLFLQYRTDALRGAADYLERAVARDPGFAQALNLLAMTWIELAEQGGTDTAGLFERAKSYVDRALATDPRLGDTHGTAGYLRMAWNYDWTGAEEQLREALRLSPGSGYVHDLLARVLWSVGRYDDALPLARRAQALDPMAHRNDLTTLLLRAGRFPEALQQALDVIEINPDGAREHATLGWAYFLGGDQQRGLAALEHAVALEGRGPWLPQLAQAYALGGRRSEAVAILRDLTARAATEFISPYHLAYIHTGLGDTECAIELLERAVASRTGPHYSIKGSFLFASLRGHPRFQRLMASMNLA